MLKRLLQLEASAAYVSKVVPEQANLGQGFNARTGFFNLLAIHQHSAPQDQRLGALTRGGQATFEQQFVEPHFQGKFSSRSISPEQPAGGARPAQIESSAPGKVQGAENILNKQLISVLSGFPTEFSTVVLKSEESVASLGRTTGFRAPKGSDGSPALYRRVPIAMLEV
jgi:hypothetical protein